MLTAKHSLSRLTITTPLRTLGDDAIELVDQHDIIVMVLAKEAGRATAYGQAVVAPRLLCVIQQYPKVRLDLQFSDERVNIVVQE